MANSQLPPEIWQLIFRQATFTPRLLETTWDYSPEDRIWDCWTDEVERRRPGRTELPKGVNGTKGAIVLVCRQWREIGVEFLFESIVIASNQLKPMVKAFKNASSRSATGTGGYGWWTKRIDCDGSTVSPGCFWDFMALLERCHNIEVISAPKNRVVELDSAMQVRLRDLLQSRFARSLRRLELYASLSIIPNIPLTTLGIAVRTEIKPEDVGLLKNPSAFDHITSLILDFPVYVHQIPSEWTFPSLQNLGLLNIATSEVQLLQGFVSRHQPTLIHLRVGVSSQIALPTLISNPSGLSSITLDEMDFQRLGLSSEINLPGPTYLGISRKRSWDSTSLLRHGLEATLRGTFFPDLRTIRMLAWQSPVDSTSEWIEMIELCGEYGVRFEDMNGRPITLYK